jgi:hypothetical protein
VKAERRVRRTKVYNLTVAQFHTYFVGRTDGGVWVHNTLCPPQFQLANRVHGQLQDPRLGPLAGRLTPRRLNELLNNPNAQRLMDAESGHINIIQRVDGVLLRITVPRDAFRIISVGPIRARSVANGIASGRYVPLR